MEVFIAVAMVCVFIAGRKSVKNRLTRVENHTDYEINLTYEEQTNTLTITEVRSR